MSLYSKEVVFKGIDLIVWFYFNPEEKATREEPGCPEEFDLEAVYLTGVDQVNIFPLLSEDYVEELSDLIKKESD